MNVSIYNERSNFARNQKKIKLEKFNLQKKRDEGEDQEDWEGELGGIFCWFNMFVGFCFHVSIIITTFPLV